MAPRKQPFQRRGSQSPNTALVIFLIFFVLGTIVAGVMAYYGYAGQDALKKSAAEALNKAKASQKAEEWGQFQSLLARKALGAPLTKEDPDEETQWKAALDGMQIDAATGTVKADATKFKDEKNRASVEDMFKKAIQDLRWDPAGQKFQTTYRDRVAKLVADLAKAQGDYSVALKQKDDLKDEIEKLAARRKEFYETLQQTAKKSGEEALAAALEKTKEITKLLELNNETNEKLKQTKEKFEQELRGRDEQIHKLRNALTRAQKGQPAAEAAGGPGRPTGPVHALMLDISAGKPLWDRPVGRITRTDDEGRKAYLDIGQDEGIQPQMTFLVFGGTNGKAEGRIKGTVEVQEVVGPHTSVAWVTSIYDSTGAEVPLYDRRRTTLTRQGENPIRDGDLLFNMALGTHVAVAGSAGGKTAPEQMSRLRQLLSQLRRQGAVVDAYVDLGDGQVKGAVTPHTNFLLRGELPSASGEAGSPGAKVAKAAADSAKAMTEQATANGAFIISVDNFLLVTGYRRPGGAAQAEVSSFRPGLPTAGTGSISDALKTRPEPKKEDKK